MSVESALNEALRFLSQEKSWRLDELSEHVTDGVLHILDDRGYIEVEIYKESNARSEVLWRWFSPSREADYAGGWDYVLRIYRRCVGKERNQWCNLRVSGKGNVRLEEAKLDEGAIDAGEQAPESEAKRAASTSIDGYVPADTLAFEHGIRPQRLSEAARQGKVKTKPAPRGQTNSAGKRIRLLYHEQEAIEQCTPKKRKSR